jgi:DNA-binding MarR family transcriptional regulator
MSSKTKTESKPSPEEAVKAAVEKHPGATAEGIAGVAGIGRSTAGKALGRLADADEVVRHQGGRDQGKRLPDRWTLAGVEMPDTYAHQVVGDAKATPAATAEGKGKAPVAKSGEGTASDPKSGEGAASASEPEGGKLKPNELNPLVLGYLQDNADKGPHSPTDIAKALQRSSGAVGNCLERLTKDKKVKRVVDKPRRYAIA